MPMITYNGKHTSYDWWYTMQNYNNIYKNNFIKKTIVSENWLRNIYN